MSGIENNSDSDPVVAQIKDYINEHYNEKLDLTDICLLYTSSSMDRYKIGSGTLSLIMERYHAGGIPIEELQMMPPKEVELLFYPQKNIKKKDIPFPDFQYYLYRS